MKNLSDFSELCNILELSFVLSHRQADKERGSSLNKNLLKQKCGGTYNYISMQNERLPFME